MTINPITQNSVNTPPMIEDLIFQLQKCSTQELEFMLGELMSDITQQSFCASWRDETLQTCKEIYDGKRKSRDGGWDFDYWQRIFIVALRDKLEYWVELNPDNDEPMYIREKQ